MFESVASEIASRMLAARMYVAHIEPLESKDSALSATFKGLAFVQLYAIYEYTVRSGVQATLSAIRGDPLVIRELRHELLCLVLDPQWTSASTAGRSRRWDTRIALIRKVTSQEPTHALTDTLFPSDGSHYRIRQLHTIWNVFAIAEPVVPNARLIGRIEELVENRNAIAHGTRTAADVGRRYSCQDIALRVDDVEQICVYIVDTMRRHYEAHGHMSASVVGT